MTGTYDKRLRRGRRSWDQAATTFYPAFDRTRARVDDLALQHLELQPGQSVLDIGCGTGAALVRLREAVGEQGRVVGVDYSPRMVARSQRRVREHGWANVTIRRADAARESLGHNEFDAAIALSSLTAMPDVRAAVQFAHDALRPGGRLFVFDMRLLITGNLGARMITRLMRGIYRATAGFTGADVIAELQRAFATVTPAHPKGGLGTSVTLALATKSDAAASTRG